MLKIWLDSHYWITSLILYVVESPKPVRDTINMRSTTDEINKNNYIFKARICVEKF